MNERVTVNGAVFFVGWRLTPYPTYSFVARISAALSGAGNGLVQQRIELTAVFGGQRIAGTEGGEDLLQHLARLAVASA